MVRAACESAAWLEVEADTPAEATAASVPAAVTTIDLSHQQLTVSSLQLLPSTLTCVDLSRCGLESVAPLSRLPRLELLNVSYNRLTSLEDVQHSGHLKVLYARSNRITHLDGAAQLALLQSLDLECNSLSSLESLTPLWNLRSLTELRLRGNVLPIAAYRRTCAAKLPLLRSLDGSDMKGRQMAVAGTPPSLKVPTRLGHYNSSTSRRSLRPPQLLRATCRPAAPPVRSPRSPRFAGRPHSLSARRRTVVRHHR